MKSRALLWLGLLASLNLLGGCAGGPDLNAQPFFTPATDVRADQATLYFYRATATIGYGIAPAIKINGKTISSLPSGGYFKTHLPAGTYRIDSTSPPLITNMVNKHFDLKVENGQTYYIADQISTSPFNDGLTLGAVDDGSFGRTRYYFRYALLPEEQALRSIQWCRQVPTPQAP
ncbi:MULTISPECIES: DUF2846 domain-containing protein [Pseudomonas chlororaphis group]|uniref:DUF2846 domain-containing protein n=1 Tax=Pseudomonas chlororaphis group TaxID=136842 RepID=UPI002098372D|nr:MULTISPECIES: DUF2846 domain-containing protein [Pseudomonas chlororaphis group]MCO7579867.1 DUF2846 domain-containing protein [Pseudomonas protegens]MCO7585915.1 DUF2846 domain-containing protein [Pseudomonas chlororaphis]MCO7603063.1 DUF2846 domain-containing protein [Pseudomonas chlororaphis]